MRLTSDAARPAQQVLRLYDAHRVILLTGRAELQSVFVSYRREDSAGYAGRLAEHLGGAFGAAHVFMDVQDIAPGQDFAAAIENTISACQAVVIVIGPRWLSDLQERAGREAFVLYEVRAALRRQATVIPVLVGGARMPSAAELPADLAQLSRRQALEMRDTRFDDDVKALVRALHQSPGFSTTGRKRWIPIAAVTLLAIAALAGVLWKQRPHFDVNGVWIAELQKPNQRPFRVRLDLAENAGKLTGAVSYPTGDGAIQAGTLDKGRLAFFTVHTPQFASEPATIRWTGTVEGDTIRFTVADDNGVSTGIARRRQ